MNENEEITEKEISKLRIGEILAKLKDSKARSDIDVINQQITITDKDFEEIFTGTID
jgi:hypothetical protein